VCAVRVGLADGDGHGERARSTVATTING
jgi:hypothetical protein